MGNQKLNMEKILEITNKYFKGNKDVNLTDLQIELLRNVSEYDDATNNLIKWLNDEIENDEERSMENYLAEVTNAYEMMLSEKEVRKFEQDLKRLNPDVDIKLDENCTSIDISKSAKELKLPENFYLDENNRITNKENTALSVFVSLKVNEIKKNNKNVERKKDMTKEEKFNEEEILDGEILNEIPKKKVKKPKFRLFKTIKKGLNFIKNKFIIPDDLMDEEIDLDNAEELNIQNKDSKKQDTDKKAEEPKNVNNTKKDEEVVNKSETPKENVEHDEAKSNESNESHTETLNTTLSAGENLKRIAKIRSEIERLQRNKEELKNIQNASKYAKEETAKHYDEETKKLRDQIKEIVDNNKYTNESGREISMEERDRFDRLDAVQADIIESVKKQKQINSEFNEAWYGHMGEKVTEDLLKRRSTLKNELDAINIKLNLLKQKREEIVAENPMTHARTM